MSIIRHTETGWLPVNHPTPDDEATMSMVELAGAIEDLHLTHMQTAEVWCRLGGDYLWLYLYLSKVLSHEEAIAFAQDEDPDR